MAEDASPPAVVSAVKLVVADGSDYDGTFYVGESVADGKLHVGTHGDVDVFFVLVSGYLVCLHLTVSFLFILVWLLSVLTWVNASRNF